MSFVSCQLGLDLGKVYLDGGGGGMQGIVSGRDPSQQRRSAFVRSFHDRTIDLVSESARRSLCDSQQYCPPMYPFHFSP